MRDSGSHLFFNGVGCEVLLKQRLLNPKESSFNVIPSEVEESAFPPWQGWGRGAYKKIKMPLELKGGYYLFLL